MPGVRDLGEEQERELTELEKQLSRTLNNMVDFYVEHIADEEKEKCTIGNLDLFTQIASHFDTGKDWICFSLVKYGKDSQGPDADDCCMTITINVPDTQLEILGKLSDSYNKSKIEMEVQVLDRNGEVSLSYRNITEVRKMYRIWSLSYAGMLAPAARFVYDYLLAGGKVSGGRTVNLPIKEKQ